MPDAPVPVDKPELLEQDTADQQFLAAVQSMTAAKRPRVRVRVLLQLYRFGKGQRYKNWRGLVWRLDLEPTTAASGHFRGAFGVFMAAITSLGPQKVAQVLEEAMRGN